MDWEVRVQRGEKEREMEIELQTFSHQRQNMNRDGETGERWETRPRKSRLGCHALLKDGSPEQEWWRKRREKKKKSFSPSLPPPPPSHPASLSCCVTHSVSPLGFNQADSLSHPFGGRDEGRGDLSSAGINLCDRGLLDESDHPCWLAGWMEPGVWGDVAEGKVTARRALNFKGCLHSGFQL